MKIKDNNKYIDRWLSNNLDILKNNNEKRDLDTVILVTGKEGTGKSTLAMQIGYYFDREFSLNDVTFNITSFNDRLLSQKRGKVVMLDEGDEISGTNWSNQEVKSSLSVLKRVRKKNMYIIICTPDYFSMHNYLVLRCNCLLNCRFGNKNERIFDFYSAKRAAKMHLHKRSKRWLASDRNFYGYYTKWLPFDKQAYEDKKDESIMETRMLGKSPSNARKSHAREVIINTH